MTIREVSLDLTAEEMMVLLVLATLGETVMANDTDAVKKIVGFLLSVERGPELAKAALDKLQAAANIATAIVPEIVT